MAHIPCHVVGVETPLVPFAPCRVSFDDVQLAGIQSTQDIGVFRWDLRERERRARAAAKQTFLAQVETLVFLAALAVPAALRGASREALRVPREVEALLRSVQTCSCGECGRCCVVSMGVPLAQQIDNMWYQAVMRPTCFRRWRQRTYVCTHEGWWNPSVSP